MIFSKNTHRMLVALLALFLVACGNNNSSTTDGTDNTDTQEETDNEGPQNDEEDNSDNDQDGDQNGDNNDDDNLTNDQEVDCSVTPYDIENCPQPLLADAVDTQISARPNTPYDKFQLEDSLYVSNVYEGNTRAIIGTDAEGNPILDPDQLYYSFNGSDYEQDYVEWQVPADRQIAGNPCAAGHGNESTTLSYRMTYRNDVNDQDRFTFVRAFPAMVIGTMGGRFDSWGEQCDQKSILTSDYQRDGNSPVFDMELVQEATGFPTFIRDLPDPLKISVKADLNSGSATNGFANIFLDSYWHDVSTRSKLPGAGNEIDDVAAYEQWLNTIENTINGINADYTEVWNLNIWFDWTETDDRTAANWTGGISLGTVQIDDNPQFEIYLKTEGKRQGNFPDCEMGRDGNNCFLYIALVATDRQLVRSGVTINYTEIANWMQSNAFKDLFLDGADLQGTGEAAGIAYEMWRTIDGPSNDREADAAKRGPPFPNENHVLGGMHLGAELWFNPQGQRADITFDTLGVAVNGKGYFGNYEQYPLD